jgi:beta-1,4-mannosyl-glycoprotein beta-1,4-N-acetylglucosaminyltransferase
MKIYDCFMFFNEIDILYIRMKTLYNLVDYFIIVDSNHTHQGEKRKHLYFEKHIDKFEEFKDKIIYKKIDIINVNNIVKYENEGNSWKRIHYHRDYIKTILEELNCNDDDIILISDVDEIPYQDKIIEVINTIKTDEIYFFHMLDIRYFLNNKNIVDFIGMFVLRFNNLKNINSISLDIRHTFCHHRSINDLEYKIKTNNKQNKYKIIKKGGLHLSSYGGFDSQNYKTRAYSHIEYNKNNDKLNNEINTCDSNLHNSTKFRNDSNFDKWFNFSTYFDIDYNDNFNVEEYILDEIKENKEKYAHFFIFKQPYLD